MRKIIKLLVTSAFLLGVCPAYAVTLAFEVIPLAGNNYEYTYTVHNATLAQALQEFTVFFAPELYENLSLTSPLANWDEVAVDPDPLFLAEGFYDALALSGGLAPGDSLSGFSVRFTWLGGGLPGAQPFVVIDPISSAVLADGTTVMLAPNRVSTPGSLWLVAAGLIGGLCRRRCLAALFRRTRWLWLIAGVFHTAVAFANVTIGTWVLTTTTRISRFEFEFTYQAHIVNTGPAVAGGSATLTSTSPHTTVLDGDLRFGPIAANGTVLSTDTFTLRQDRRFPGDPSSLHWTFTVQTQPALGLTVTEPVEGATVEGDTLTVTGELQAPPNTGVTVNGTVAALVPEAGLTRFYATVPLDPGANTLTVQATTQDGRTSTQTLTVTSRGSGRYGLRAEPGSGVAPLEVRWTVADRSGGDIQRIDLDFESDGTVDFTTTDATAEASHTYPNPGVYTATAQVLDSAGTLYPVTLTLVVENPQAIHAQLQALWSGLNSALLSGNTQTALGYLHTAAQEKYGPVFQALLPHMPQIINSYSELQLVELTSDFGEYAINRTIEGVHRLFFIYFVRGRNGVWYLDSM